jgi:cardiolipin synthase
LPQYFSRLKYEMKKFVRTKFNQPYTLHNSAEWIQSGKIFFDRLEALIDSAKIEIHLQTYIFALDRTGSRIYDALIRASNRNVKIFILVDAYGSPAFNTEILLKMIAAGIQVKKYGKLFSKGRFHIGRRMHHKIFVVDGYISIVGGINISDNYNDFPESNAWLDFAVLMQGNITRRLQYICRQRWLGWNFTSRINRSLLHNVSNENNRGGNIPIRTRRNDFARNKNDIAISYREAIRHAQKSILIVGGYFLPGGRTRRLMRKAIQRGVRINVIISEKSDVKILISARKYLYAWLIRNNIGVYEYTRSNVHGKVIITDDDWTSIGSYDLNNLSTYSNIELNVDIKDENFSQSLSSHIKKIMLNECRKLTSQNMYRYKSLFSKFRMWVAYRFVKTLFVLSVLLAGKKEKEF